MQGPCWLLQAMSLELTGHVLVEKHTQQKVKTYFKFCINLLSLFSLKKIQIVYSIFNHDELNLPKKK